MRRLPTVIPVVLIVLAPAAMLYPLWGDPTSAGEDDVTYYYPLRKLVGQSLRAGDWPLENPREATGTPLMGDPQSAAMYPPTWLFAFLDAKLAYSLTLFLGFSLAGGGAWAYLRRLGLRPAAACFGSLAFMFCGFLVGHRVHWSLLHAAAYLPWGLWCIEGLRRRCGPAFAWMTPVAYLTITTGHWPTLIHMGLIWTAYLLLRARPLWRAALAGAAAMVLAAALAAPQIDATRRTLAAATRNRIGYATAGENSFYPASGALALFPFLFGSRTPNLFPQPWWGPWHLCETLGYVGLGTLVLAGAAVWRLYRKPRLPQPAPARPEEAQKATRGREPSECLSSSPEGAQEVSRGREPPDTDAPTDPAPEGRRSAGPAACGAAAPGALDGLRPLVRAWTWIALGAGIWMLGYYLPTYRLIHMLPVLGVVRCPARMLLAVDMALATLAAIAVHVLMTGGEGPRPAPGATAAATAGAPRQPAAPSHAAADPIARLAGTVRRGATVFLPATMLAVLVLLALAAGAAGLLFGGEMIFFQGGAGRQALRAVMPTNPAVWVQAILAAATILVIRWWLGAPSRRHAALVALLLLDLFFITRFVDVPGRGHVPPDPEVSPAGEWLAAHGPGDRELYRVWGIGETYHDRPAELLRPKTAHALGFSTINSYGPFQAPAHAHLLGFRIFGTNDDWAGLIRRNWLLSAYGVRYILTARKDVREVLDSVRVLWMSPSPEEPNLLSGNGWLDRARDANGVLSLRTPVLWHWAIAKQPVKVKPEVVYRIALDARGPDGGAANYLRAEVFSHDWKASWDEVQPLGLTVYEEQMGADWRHFERTFHMPQELAGDVLFRVFTMSERTIEVRNLSLRESEWEVPVVPGNRLERYDRLYRLIVELPAHNSGDAPVAIYENMGSGGYLDPVQWEWMEHRGRLKQAPEMHPATPAETEKLKGSRPSAPADLGQLPRIGLVAEADPHRVLWVVTVPAAGLYVLIVIGLTAAWRARRARAAPSGDS